MQYESETKNCQNCKNDFTIEPDDFYFYEKIGVQKPRLCSNCRAQLRLSFRNERVFYKRPCDKCHKDVISTYSINKPYAVWCYDCWFSDDWDSESYFLDYNENKSFFEQLEVLLKNIPKIGLIYVRSPGSNYINISADNKNCYMIIESSNNENCINCYWIQQSKDLVDSSFTNKVELSYEVDDCYNSHNLKYSKGSHDCLDSYFLVDCHGCINCFGCVNLRQKQYQIFNKQYSKEEYFKMLEDFNLDTYTGISEIKKVFREFLIKNPRKYAEVTKTINSTGNYMKNTKDCFSCFHAYDSENCKNSVHVWRGAKDCVDVDTAGRQAEVIFNSINAGLETSNQICSNLCWSSTFTDYSTYCLNSNNLLGCVGLRKKNFYILNKQYSKEEYFKLKEKIINKLKSENKWGEFLPPSFSSFGYNETAAFEQFPLSKDEALKQGFKWEDTPRGTYGKETIFWEDFPDSILDLQENFDFNKEVFKCIDCNKNYRIIENELGFYKKLKIPIPRTCPDCRHLKRFNNRGPNKLWCRKCMKEGCNNEFETSYAPDRPEIVYCEKCYQNEVY